MKGGEPPAVAAALEASAALLEAGDLQSLYDRVTGVAADLLAADCAILQICVPERLQLRLVATKGFSPQAAAFWEQVDPGSSSASSASSRALYHRERVVIADVERDSQLAGTEDLRRMRLCGIRAVQATPLLSRRGALLGVLSTYWQREYHPPQDVPLIDALARQVARLIERALIEEAQRATEAGLRARLATLERLDSDKNDFLAMLAHELRNPLAPIRNVGEVLAQVLPEEPAVQRPLAILRRQTDQLTRLVDDLLDISRIQQGRLALQERPVELGEILDHALETVQPLIREKRHELTVERLKTPVFVLGDGTRLIQCVGNLLQNAAKYTPPGGRIHVAAATSGTRVSIVVHDNGAGIAPALLPHVFEPFVQSEGTLRHSRGGLGIGLAIVKRLVGMHGGSVEAASEGEGRGSTFAIHLWRLDPAQTSVAPASGGARSKCILVVDDHPDAADSTATSLIGAGHRVEVAYSGLSALAAAEQLRPDAILLDLDLPRISGYEVARRLRARRDLGATLLIALSGNPSDEAAARSAGFDRYVAKPVDLSALQRILA